jgi:hypothetical protein
MANIGGVILASFVKAILLSQWPVARNGVIMYNGNGINGVINGVIAILISIMANGVMWRTWLAVMAKWYQQYERNNEDVVMT